MTAESSEEGKGLESAMGSMVTTASGRALGVLLNPACNNAKAEGETNATPDCQRVGKVRIG
jgi:hypothetical protein